MSNTDRQTLQTYLDRPLDELLAELDLYLPAVKGKTDVRAKIFDPVRRRLCVEWDYCRVRQDARWSDDLDLALIVLGVLSQPVLNLPIPADLTLVTAIVVRRGLDAFCGCF